MAGHVASITGAFELWRYVALDIMPCTPEYIREHDGKCIVDYDFIEEELEPGSPDALTCEWCVVGIFDHMQPNEYEYEAICKVHEKEQAEVLLDYLCREGLIEQMSDAFYESQEWLGTPKVKEPVGVVPRD